MSKVHASIQMESTEGAALELGAEAQAISKSEAVRRYIPTLDEVDAWDELTAGGTKAPYVGFDVAELRSHCVRMHLQEKLTSRRFPTFMITPQTSDQQIFKWFVATEKAHRKVKGYALDVVIHGSAEYYMPIVTAK